MEIVDCARINIKKHRKLLKMTQKEFGDCLHVKHSMVSLWETGKSPISLSRLDQICQLLNLSVEELFFDVNEPPISVCRDEGEQKDVLIQNVKKRPEIRELYKVSLGSEPKDVIVATNVLYDLVAY